MDFSSPKLLLLLVYTNFLCHAKIPAYQQDKKIYNFASDALSNIIINHLKDYQVVIMTKDSPDTKGLFRDIIENLFQNEKPVYSFFVSDESSLSTSKDNDNFLPEFIQRSMCVCVLLINDEVSWIEENGIHFGFSTTIVVSLTSSMEPSSILASPLLQRSLYLSLIEFVQIRNKTKMLIYTSFPFSYNNGKPQFSFFLGEWSEEAFMTKESILPERFTNLNGEVLHIASDEDDYPLIYINEDGELDGTNIRIVKAIGDYLNFSFDTTEQAPDGYWGEKVNDSWNGLLGMVEHDNYNFTINYFAIVLDRSKGFDFTTFYFFEGFGFALRLPPPLPAWLSLVYPFSWEVWVSVIIFIVFVSVVLYEIHIFIPWVKDSSPLMTAHLYTLQTLLRQSLTKIPDDTCTRVVLATWWIGSLIFTVSYTGNLIAVLTVPVFPEKIKTLAGLAKSDFRVAMIDYGEFVPEALLASKDPYLNAIGQKMDLLFMYDDDEFTYNNLVLKLLDGEHAITETYSYLRNLVTDHEEASPTSYFLREQIYSGALVFYFKKFTPWMPKFNDALIRLVEAGLVDKWYRDIMGEEKQDDDSSGELSPLTLYHLQGPFIILIIGNISATLFFLLEAVAGKLSRKKT